jgi:hypothetical protein
MCTLSMREVNYENYRRVIKLYTDAERVLRYGARKTGNR